MGMKPTIAITESVDTGRLPEDLCLEARLRLPVLLFISFFCIGTFGYFVIKKASVLAPGAEPINDLELLRLCTYQTAILLTGVGFSDVLASEQTWAGTLFTVMMSFFGLGFLMYFISTITAFVVGGELSLILEKKKMRNRIQNLEGHYIVCGGGETGSHVVSELLATQRPFVVIETHDERLEKLKALGDICYLQQDATEDETLLEAGIERAAGLVSSLPSDKDNILIVLTARQLNPHLRIISRCIDLANRKKLAKVGADAVVAPPMIGGLRMASELIRPNVVTFLDTMLRDRRMIRFEDIRIPADHSLVGQTLAEAKLPAVADVNIIATRESPVADFIYNPHGDLRICGGMDLVVIGAPDAILALRRYLKLEVA